MKNSQFEKNERRRKQKALWVTVTIHLMLLSGLVALSTSDEVDLKSYLPDVVKEWIDAPQEEEANKKKQDRA